MVKKNHPNQLINEIGNKYGKLTVIRRAKNKGTKAQWVCLCECGKENIVTGTDLRSGHTGSCGCGKQTWKSLPEGQGAFNSAYSGYVRSAKRRNIDFNITKNQFKEITQNICYYCGKEPTSPIRQERHNGKFPFNGIDRLDSSKGYEIGNVVACCFNCNQAKMKMTESEFYLWIDRVYNHSKRRILEALAQPRIFDTPATQDIEINQQSFLE